MRNPLGYDVRYTSDGSTPDASSTLYAGPIATRLPATFRTAAFSGDRMLADAYATAREHVMLGGELPAPAKGALESSGKRKPVPASPEVAAAHITNIREELGTPAVVDGKAVAAGPDA